ncbi:MAG: amino acid ABC transporter permease [Pleurocapsa minor GSE-CHR-MK-17-07R]|jgi:polar amino acid transport system permease protein|nr:amino acid ABC transporter permease [Pleurocapsa minor GSE-CHR-MK 17-07R]
MAQSAATFTPNESPGYSLTIRRFVNSIWRKRSWLIAFLLLDIYVISLIINDPRVGEAWAYVSPGISISMGITVVSFLFSIILGLFVSILRISKNPILYNLSTLYVELFRGLPLLVIILIFNFVVVPQLIDRIGGTADEVNDAGETVTGYPTIVIIDDFLQRLVGIPEERIESTTIRSRDIDESWRIVLAFAVTYGAFMSEVFRAGIESIGRGQMEASRSLGMSYFQAMRYIILPQAIRNILPALGNNFILLLKDTSLASSVAVPEVSYLTRQFSSNRFRYGEPLLVLSFIYANLTIILALFVNALEYYLHADKREG